MIGRSNDFFFPPPKQLNDMPLLCKSLKFNSPFKSNSHNLVNHSLFGTNKSPFLLLDRLRYAHKADEVRTYQNLLWRREACCAELMTKDFVTQTTNKFKLFKLSADSGDTDSMYTVAMSYFKGFGQRNARPNREQCFKYFSVAAKRNHPPSQYCLALILFHNFVVKQNIEKARRLIRMSSDNGFDEAQYTYGLCLISSPLFPPNEKKAYELFSSAAKQGNKNAKLLLGYSHAKGIGVEKDERKGLEIMKSVFNHKNFPNWGSGYYDFAKYLDELIIRNKQLGLTKKKKRERRQRSSQEHEK